MRRYIPVACLLLLASLVLAEQPSSAPAIDQRCSQLLSRWQTRFDEEHFTAIVAPPFVIAGDGGPAKLARYRDGTILAAQRALSATFFNNPPSETDSHPAFRIR